MWLPQRVRHSVGIIRNRRCPKLDHSDHSQGRKNLENIPGYWLRKKMIKHLSSIHFSHRPATIIKHAPLRGGFLYALCHADHCPAGHPFPIIHSCKFQKTPYCFMVMPKKLRTVLSFWRSLILNGNEKIHIIHLGIPIYKPTFFRGRYAFRFTNIPARIDDSRGMVSPFLKKEPPTAIKSISGKEWKTPKSPTIVPITNSVGGAQRHIVNSVVKWKYR